MKKYQVCSAPDCGYKFNPPGKRNCQICGESLISTSTETQKKVDSNKSIGKFSQKTNKKKTNNWVAVTLLLLVGTGSLYYFNNTSITNFKADTQAQAQELPTGVLRFWGPPCSEELMLKLIAKELNKKTKFKALLIDIDSRDAIDELIGRQTSLVLHEKSQFPQHQEKARKAGARLEGTPYALDGIAYVANTRVEGVPYLTIELLEKIYRGEITNWKQVGGPDLIIRPLLVSGLGRNSLFLNFKGKLNPNMIYSNNRKKAMVELRKNSGALFYTSATLAGEEKNVRIIPLKNNNGEVVYPVIEGKANQKAFAEGSYPQLRTLFAIRLVTEENSADSEIVDSYINYLISSEGQSIVKKRGFVPLYIPL